METTAAAMMAGLATAYQPYCVLRLGAQEVRSSVRLLRDGLAGGGGRGAPLGGGGGAVLGIRLWNYDPLIKDFSLGQCSLNVRSLEPFAAKALELRLEPGGGLLRLRVLYRSFHSTAAVAGATTYTSTSTNTNTNTSTSTSSS